MGNWEQYQIVRRKNLIFISVFSLFFNLLMLVLPLFSIQVFDRVLTSRSIETLITLSLVAIALLVFQALFQYTRTRLLEHCEAHFELSCSASIIEKIMYLPGQKARQLHDLREGKSSLSSHFYLSLNDMPWSIGFTFVLFLLHPSLGWFTVIGIFLLLTIVSSNYFLAKKLAGNLTHSALASNVMSQQIIDKLHLAKWTPALQQLLGKRKSIADETTYLEETRQEYAALFSSTLLWLKQVLQVGILALGAWLVIGQEINMGAMLAASILFSRVLAPIEQCFQLLPQWQKKRLALENILELLKEPDLEAPPEVIGSSHDLMLERVSSLNGAGKVSMRNVHFELKAGHSLAVLGEVASGKSTLLNAIIVPELVHSGRIVLNGVETKNISRIERSKTIGYIPQSVDFFETSVLNNITSFDVQESRFDRALEISRSLGLHETISRLPHGYNTMLTNQNDLLSLGEIQLLSIARAIYHQPKILVADEFDSHLDDINLEKVLHTLNHLKQQGTSIIFVCQKRASLSVADWAINLQEGSIKFAGRRESVIQKLEAEVLS